MQAGELAERAARERDRVARARRRSGTAASGASPRPASSAATVAGGDAGLVAEHQHQQVAARVDDAERRGDRRRAALAVGVVDDDVGAGEVDAGAHLVRAAADRDDELVERARAGDADDVAEQRAVAVGQQLLGAPEAAGAAGAEHEPGDERAQSARRHAGAGRSNSALQPSQQK